MKRLLTLVLLTLTFGSAAAADRTVYYHTDALGSVVAATDEQGDLLWRESYKPFGDRLDRQVSTKDNSAFFTGKPHDDTIGLSYFGARYYDPEIGRFTGIDPAGVDPANINSFSCYVYANNNPYGFVDPDGRSPAALELGKDGAIAGGALCGPWCAAAGGVGGAALGLWGSAKVVNYLSEKVEEGQEASEDGQNDSAGESGTCPSCGGKTEDKKSKIANDEGMSVSDVGDRIHEVKKRIPKSSKIRNPDVEVCTTCGEVFPKTPNNGLGDSIGNIRGD